MSNKILLLPVIGVFTFFTILIIYTKLFGPIPFSVTSVTTQKTTTFDVRGEGRVTVKPDIASVSVGVQANGSTVKAAQEQINNVINKVSQAVKALGINEKDILTTNYNINPAYDYTEPTQRITGYTASTNLLIKVRQIDKVNQAIDAATANGANQVSGVSFEVDDKLKAENEARQKAVDEAKKKAQDASRIAGFRLGKIVNYTEGIGGYPEPVSYLRAQDTKEVVQPPTQIEPGSTDIVITVTLSFDIS